MELNPVPRSQNLIWRHGPRLVRGSYCLPQGPLRCHYYNCYTYNFHNHIRTIGYLVMQTEAGSPSTCVDVLQDDRMLDRNFG